VQSCGRTRTGPQPRPRRKSIPISDIQLDSLSIIPAHSKLWIVSGRPAIQLGPSHPYSNSSGWQYLSRYVVMFYTGEILRKDEHVHHTNGVITDVRRDNLEVWLAERHGRYHANHQLLYMLRDRGGRFVHSNVLAFAEQLSGAGPDVPF
jgi:hypothetical protein